MIHSLSHKLAATIKANVPEHPASVEVLRYSISAILNMVFIVVFSLLISLITGNMLEAVTVLVSLALLRQVSGGIHLKSGSWCIIVTTLIVTALSYTAFDPASTYILNSIAFILVLVYAPSRIEGQTRIPKKYYPLLKVIALIIVGSNFIIGFSVLSAAFLVQSLTLIRIRMK